MKKKKVGRPKKSQKEKKFKVKDHGSFFMGAFANYMLVDIVLQESRIGNTRAFLDKLMKEYQQ